MSKKLFSAALIIIIILTALSACKPEDKSSINAQIRLIAENTDIWRHKDEGNIYGADNHKFCVTDLDQNGRLEVINSAIMGTGLYSKTYYFEVDESFSTLIPWDHTTDSFKKNLQADVITDTADVFSNPDTGEMFYVFNDHHRDTSAYNCTYHMCLTFKDKTVTEKMLAYWENSATTDEAGNYEITENIKTREGDTLTRDEIKSYEDTYFKDYEKLTAMFKWQSFKTEDDTRVTDLTVPELERLLADSYEKFTLTQAVATESIDNIDAQLKLIAKNAELWKHPYFDPDYTSGEFKFCVTDLDNNGRLEIISSAMQGSGLYTTSYYFEVSEDSNELLPCNNTDETNGQPDIMVDFTQCFVNPETTKRIYVVHDSVRVSGYESYHTKVLMTLKDGSITSEVIANCSSVAENPDDISKRTNTYADSNGNPLTINEYNTFAENHLEGYNKRTATFKWQSFKTEDYASAADLTAPELEKLLADSYEGFSVG